LHGDARLNYRRGEASSELTVKVLTKSGASDLARVRRPPSRSEKRARGLHPERRGLPKAC
jgi:hypothetical protein